jgi:hypothetical protein
MTGALKWVVAGTTATSVWLLFVYYQDQLTVGKCNKEYAMFETLLSTQLVYPLLAEVLVTSIQPIPLVHRMVQYEVRSTHDSSRWEVHEYTLDSILSLFVVGRVYLLYGQALAFFATSSSQSILSLFFGSSEAYTTGKATTWQPTRVSWHQLTTYRASPIADVQISDAPQSTAGTFKHTYSPKYVAL